jgi:hypothetical protein
LFNTRPNSQPILVTGAHRTGTSWVGKMLAAGEGVTYISEPLNVLHRPGVMRAPVDYWYIYICRENEGIYLLALRETLRFRYHTWAEIRSLRSGKDLLRMGRDWSSFLRGRMGGHRPLLKDPFAVFSLPWFIEQLGCQVVVTVRHPAAFASSLKRLNWPFQIGDLLAQPLLMRDWLEPYRQEMEALLSASDDTIERGSLLWRMVYGVVSACCQRFPQITIVRHEDLSLKPVEGYRSLYAALGIPFSEKIENVILNSSSSENPKELSKKKAHAVRLDSRSNLDNWKRRLSPEEIERIHGMTADLAAEFYPDGDWE